MKHPEWKQLYDEAGGLIASGKTEFAYAELRELGGVDVQTPQGRKQFERFRKECLSKLSVWLENVRGEGYRVIAAREHVNSAAVRVNRARRMTGKALAISSNVRFDEMTDAEKTAALAAQAAIGTLYLATKQTTKKTRQIAGSVDHPAVYLQAITGSTS